MATQKPGKTGKPVKSPAKPGDGLFGWLGRQVGHVKKAVKTDVTKAQGPAPSKEPTAKPQAAQPATAAADAASVPAVIYRDDKVEEVDHPTRPGVKLRRRIIDEVIVEPERTGPDAQP